MRPKGREICFPCCYHCLHELGKRRRIFGVVAEHVNHRGGLPITVERNPAAIAQFFQRCPARPVFETVANDLIKIVLGMKMQLDKGRESFLKPVAPFGRNPDDFVEENMGELVGKYGTKVVGVLGSGGACDP